MTDHDDDERKEFLRRLFGDKPEPADPEASVEQQFVHNLFHRDPE